MAIWYCTLRYYMQCGDVIFGDGGWYVAGVAVIGNDCRDV